MKCKWLLFLGILFIIGLGGWWYRKNQPQPIHFHAGFQVYDNDQLVDFSGDEFMHLEVCSTDPQVLENDPEGNVHLHSGVGDVAHIHRDGVVWGDLFTNLEFSLPASAAAYLNGQKVDQFKERLIEPYDSLIIFTGSPSEPEQKLRSGVTPERIKEVEKIKEACGS